MYLTNYMTVICVCFSVILLPVRLLRFMWNSGGVGWLLGKKMYIRGEKLQIKVIRFISQLI